MRFKFLFRIAPVSALALIFVAGACSSLKVDKEFMQGLKDAAANCKVDTRYANLKECKNDEDKKNKKMIKDKGYAKTIAAIAKAMNSKDLKLVAAACRYSYSDFKHNMGVFQKNPKLLPKIVVDKLLEGLKKNKEYVIFYCARTAAHAALIKGGYDDKLFAIVDQHPVKAVHSEVYMYGLKYGRMRVFPKIKGFLESNDKSKQRWAVTALRNVYNYTKEEKEKVCPVVEKYIDVQDKYVARYAAYILAGKCKGKYIEKALDAAEKRAQDGTLDKWYVYDAAPFNCSKSFLKSKEANAERCKRRAALRKKAGIDK